MLLFAGKTSSLEAIRDFVSSSAKSAGFSNELSSELTMSVDELCTNIIKHAYQEQPDLPEELKKIKINLLVIKKGLKIIIQDSGSPFNPLSFPTPDLDEHTSQYKTNGLGIFTVKKFTDRFEHRYIKGKGNRITIYKYLPVREG